MIKIVEVKDKGELKEFVSLPFSIYKNDPNFTPELRFDQLRYFTKRNPFLRKAEVRLYIALRNGKPLGRVASIVNPVHIDLHKEKCGFFGFLEVVNDQEVFELLIKRVEEDLKKAGCSVMRGPMNFSTNEQCGILIEGFEYTPTIMTPYNPQYYKELYERASFRKAKDLLAFRGIVPDKLPEKIYKAAALAEKRGVRTRIANIKELHRELKIFQSIYNDAWKDNWGFVPIDDEELDYIYHRLKPIVEPDLMIIAEKGSEPLGFLGLVPDYGIVLRKMKGVLTPISILKALYWRKKIEGLRLLLLGVKSGFRQRGVEALMFREGFKSARKYKWVEYSWILEDNLPTIRLVEMIGAEPYRRFRVYEKEIQG